MTEVLLELLRGLCTKKQAENLLREVGLPFSSPTWKDLVETRLRPALKSQDLSIAALEEAVRGAEEYGRQQTFLFKALDAGDDVLTQSWDGFASLLAKAEDSKDASQPKWVLQPKEAVIADIRTRQADGGIVIKIVETHEHRSPLELVKDSSNEGYEIFRREVIRERSVCVFRLRPTGLLEARLQTHDRGRSLADYEKELERIWGKIDHIFPRKDFTPFHIRRHLRRIWEAHQTLGGRILFTRQEAETSGELQLLVGSTPSRSLAGAMPSTTAINAFLAADGQILSSSYVWAGGYAGNPNDRDVRVYVRGAEHQFAIGNPVIGMAVYEYVIEQMVAHLY